MMPRVTKLMKAFLDVMGAMVSPHTIWECWPSLPENILQQNMEGVHAIRVVCLDEDALCPPSLTAWDMFTFLEDSEHWHEEYLSYCPNNEVNMGARMLGLWLMIQSPKGTYEGCSHILLYEGWMLTYNLASNLSDWVPMCGVPSTLMPAELKSAYDLSNFILHPCPGAMPQSGASAKPLHGPRVAEDEEMWLDPTEESYSTEKWDDDESADWSHCLSPSLEGAVGEYGRTSG